MINATVIRIGPCEVNAKLTLKENKTNDVKQNSKTDGEGHRSSLSVLRQIQTSCVCPWQMPTEKLKFPLDAEDLARTKAN